MIKVRSLAGLMALTLSVSAFASSDIPRNVTRQTNNMAEVMNLDAAATEQLQQLILNRQQQIEEANNISDNETKRAERSRIRSEFSAQLESITTDEQRAAWEGRERNNKRKRKS